MRKTFKTLIVTVIVSILLLSATTIAANAQQTVITVWHALPKENTKLFETLLNKYIAKSAGMTRLKVKRFETPDALHKALLSEGEKPDVALIDTRWQDAILDKNKLVYMEDIIKNKVGNSVFIVFKMDTFKPMWKSSKHKGKLLSMPFAGYNRALIINKEIMARYTKKLPKVWRDIMIIGKNIAAGKLREGQTKPETEEWAFFMPMHGTPHEMATFYQVLLWQTNGDVFEDFMGGELVGFETKQGKYILQTLVDMIHKHRVSPRRKISTDNVAMFIGTPFDYMRMKEQGKDIRVIRWPGHNRSANDLVVYSFIVFDKGDEKKIDKIWHLVYDAVEFQSGLKWALETPFLPPNKQVTLSPNFFAYIKGYPGIKKFVQQLKNAKVSKLNARRARAMEVLGINLKRCLNGQMKVDACLSTTAKQANMILDPQGALRARKEKLKSVSGYVDKVWDKDI